MILIRVDAMLRFSLRLTLLCACVGEGLCFSAWAQSGSQSVIEFRRDGSEQDSGGNAKVSPEALARWHIEKNVCPGFWTVEEFATLFPRIDLALVQEVCEEKR